MEFCTFGIQINDPRVTNDHPASTRTLLDFNVVVIDPSGIADAHSHFPRRQRDLEELLTLGGTVVWLVRPGSLHNLLPISETTAAPSSGTKTEFVGSDFLRGFWTSIEPIVHYQAYLGGAYGEAFLKIRNTQRIIGSWIRHKAGLILLLPRLRDYTTPHQDKDDRWTLLNAIQTLAEQYHSTKRDASRPPWSLSYSWQKETTARKELNKLTRAAEETEKAIANVSAELKTEDKFRDLFTEKGDLLVDAVIDAFRALGAVAERGEPGRDDVIVTFGDSYAVLEVKGKKGSAAEKDAAQLEKWVAGFKENHEKDAKGILVVNAFCETPLDERSQPAFPDQMLNYCSKREHCLITSTQLLGIVLASREKQQEASRYLKKIFRTVGIFDEFIDHNGFLLKSEVDETEAA
jgi:hypothetical protein